MMIDYEATAAALYPTMVQNVPGTLPVEAKPAIQPPGTKAPEQTPADTGQAPTAEQDIDSPYPLTLPEDAVIEAGAIERTMAFAKAAGLSPEAAQQALEHANGEVAAYQEQVTNEWTTLRRETWVTEAKNDQEIGGEKFQGAMTDAKRFLEKFGDEELRQFLDDTGFINNRMVIRLLARAEKGITKDRRAAGAGETHSDHATMLYGNISWR
ncbi:MAG: hypothetical protein EHM80_14325 [Nitrospiraceae bacterium]|nr:MAG: hypothetical protein EHM80_14325 [Nitrospiraceae bacterium]